VILVTAAGGKTGRHVIAALRARGLDVRALARTERVHELRTNGVETVVADMLDASQLADAVAGTDAVIHIGPAFHPREAAMGEMVVDAAAAAGVARFVQFSVYHPQIEFLLNHQSKLRVEDYLVASGLDYTILQPMHYMQNFDPVQIARDGVFRLQYSLVSSLAFVDLADVAEVAARVVSETGHSHATYPLCGSDVLTGADIAQLISERARKPVVAEQLTIDDFINAISQDHPLPPYTIDGLHRLFTYYGLHGITGNPNVLRWLLGREPTTFARYVERRLAHESVAAIAH
jgi:uncharacterized protein YbjT (DUF2867 family)